ncbi:MAG: hypothetical protein WBH47_23405, partial [Streptosporangiaceae bacterium]
MNSPHPPADSAEANGQLLPQRVAELAGELTEAADEPRRRRLARQISGLASRGSDATRRGMASGSGAAWRGTQTGA